MSPNKFVLSVLVLAVSSLPLVWSTSDCPCSLPGNPGTITKFLAKTGTTDKVSFYTEFESCEARDTLRIWAAKDIDMNMVPIQNLSIDVYFDDKPMYHSSTDDSGLFEFTPRFGGEFEIKGGDASLGLSVTPSEMEIALEKIFDSLSSIFGFSKDAAYRARVSLP
ncbi:MAG: hypothetical protein JXB14_07100 [Candidatus Altiarchaeota archaeon]|nr:hypothetical protein [Candidatus Altiarchaeota archaeon]